MKDITHKILSEVHHLLSVASEDELRGAANLPNNSPHLRGALEALAAEKASAPRRGGAGGAETPSSRRPAVGSTQGGKSNVSSLARDLARSFDKLGKGEIQEACRSVGLPLSMRPKDARERIIRRVANLLAGMAEDERERVLAAMRTRADTQTEGWVGVIRKGQ